jgi:hypothetical protein
VSFLAALEAAGVPREFSFAAAHQEIPAKALVAIDAFVEVFDRVTGRASWREAVTRDAPAIARGAHREVCFFSAWDFHLPPDAAESPRLIEFNDNGSGFLFAGIANRAFWDAAGLAARRDLEAPPDLAELLEGIASRVEREAHAFFGAFPAGVFLILDDADSLARGRFRRELELQRELFRARGWESELAAPEDLVWDGRRLRARGRAVAFVVNRSTDFLWEGEALGPLRRAWASGAVYAAPNPSTYATRSDKGLLALLSRGERDAELGITPDERRVLSARVPDTWRVCEEDADALAERKQELVFKPARSYGGRGLLPSGGLGRSRLRRLARSGELYVAQERVPKARLDLPDAELWADLRVWAYRGRRFLLSGRASRRPDRLDLEPPGGWLPTYARR